jgi:hypothetical protein
MIWAILLKIINHKKNSKFKDQISKTSVKLKDDLVLNFELGFELLVLIFDIL